MSTVVSEALSHNGVRYCGLPTADKFRKHVVKWIGILYVGHSLPETLQRVI